MTPQQKAAADKLAAGEKVENYKEGGNSMVPIIKNRQPVTIEPCDPSLLEKGDVVLVTVRGRTYTHKVIALRKGQVQIGNNKGGVNGWANLDSVHGIVTEVDGVKRGGADKKVKK